MLGKRGHGPGFGLGFFVGLAMLAALGWPYMLGQYLAGEAARGQVLAWSLQLLWFAFLGWCQYLGACKWGWRASVPLLLFIGLFFAAVLYSRYFER